MNNYIEKAKSGRARCRNCQETIIKDELRLGIEVPNAFSDGDTTYHWYHLPCAAKKKPSILEEAITDTEITIPNKEELLKEIAANKKNQKSDTYPFAERAKTSRSNCIICEEKIEKDTLRIVVEREIDTGSFVTKGAGYLHVSCAVEHFGEDFDNDELLTELKKNSPSLSPSDFEEIESEFESE